MNIQLINSEKFTSIQQAQAGLTRLFEKAGRESSFYRVLRNNKPLGVLIPNDLWESLSEDLEAMASEEYKRKVREARGSSQKVSLSEAKKQLGV